MIFPPNCIRPVGPRPAKIAFVGEAPSEQEELTGIPFIGSSGQELDRMLSEVGLVRAEAFLTNVLLRRPPGNKFEAWLVKKADNGGQVQPPIEKGLYLHPDLLPELDRLRAELREAQPNLVVALGAKALWALCGASAISKLRGSIAESTLIPGLKVLPTFHPSFVMRAWQVRPIVLSDLFKAVREANFPDIRRPERTVYIEPNLSDLQEILRQCLAATRLSIDIETTSRTITCIGFSPSPKVSYNIPFFDPRKPDGNYWEKDGDEVAAWRTVKTILASPIPKLFQNGLYDIQYLSRMGFRIHACHHDTMILHHALFPEMQKDLGFLGSIYTNEASWKLMRSRSDSNKREE